MSSIFTRIINGEIPGRFVWRDSECVAFMDIQPISRGHLLVVPRQETDRWHDLPPQTAAHLFAVAHKIAAALDQLSERSRVGLMIAGFDVPHTHIHLMPADSMAQFDPKNADKNARPEDLDAMARKIRDALRALGHGANVPED
ncbi:HIT family protein [Lautropia dentalis]|jgi:HIT family protein|uniref:HIT family protein n=1 Tax=Lautropia dentalis TaxID=2490857 RepID=A0A426FPB8_9BURK|nr:HIT family protein [Lautropia dentalis]RRN44513.1 HIT family protein [Lautropia dentalis]